MLFIISIEKRCVIYHKNIIKIVFLVVWRVIYTFLMMKENLVLLKSFKLIQHSHKMASHAVLSRGVVILPLRNKK